MATIGLDRLYYAKITENDAGEETYGTPSQLAKAISADLSVELAEATLYADDGASEIVKEFKSGTLSLGIDDIGSTAASDLTGATIDKNKVLISASEDGGAPVAVGFRAKKSNGKYKYYWLYRVKFGIPATNLATKGDSITFSTPTIEGILRIPLPRKSTFRPPQSVCWRSFCRRATSFSSDTPSMMAQGCLSVETTAAHGHLGTRCLWPR